MLVYVVCYERGGATTVTEVYDTEVKAKTRVDELTKDGAWAWYKIRQVQ